MQKVEKILLTAQDRLVTIQTDALLIDAAKLLNNPKLNLVVVCNESGKMAGVITRTDIVGRISHCTGCSCTMEASRVMTREVTFCQPTSWLGDVWATIKEHGQKNIPIVDEDIRPVGVLNARDVLQVLLEDVEYEEQLLRDYVMCVGYH